MLFLLPFAPRQAATNGGARVLTQFLTEITLRHKVAILYFREAGEPGADPLFHERCEYVEEVVRPASRKSLLARVKRYLRMTLSLLVLRPIWVSDWASGEFTKRACLLAQRFQPDIIQFELHVMGQYLSGLRDIRAQRLLVEYESSAQAALYLQNLLPFLNDIIARIERISWQRYERTLYRQVDAIVVFTRADQQSTSKTAGRTPIHIIPPGTSIPERALDPLGSLQPSLLFVGNFHHPPNADAARRLIDSIFPLVRQRLPEAKLFIVGESPPPELNRSNSKNVIITGRVPDVTPYLDQASLFVAPLRLGGGMRIKILEALAAGKAVLATRLAADGLDVQDGEQIFFAEADGEFVTQVIELIKNPDKRVAVARSARCWAHKNIDWERTVMKYEALYQGLLRPTAASDQQLPSNSLSDREERSVL